MSTITDIFQRIAERRGWINVIDKSEFDSEEAWEQDPDVQAKLKEKKLWNDIMKQLHEPFAVASEAMDEGLQHAGLLLELVKPPKAKKGATEDIDVEAKADIVAPGEEGFMEYLEKKLDAFYCNRGETIRAWAREKGLSGDQWDAAQSPGLDDSGITPDEIEHTQDQQQLYLILYMEFLVSLSSLSSDLSMLRFPVARCGCFSHIFWVNDLLIAGLFHSFIQLEPQSRN